MSLFGLYMKRISMTAAVLLLLSAVLAGCGSGTKNGTQGSGGDDSWMEEPLTAPGDEDANTEDGEHDEETETVLTGTGIYKGQIDNNSIEIETPQGPEAFRHDESLTELISSLSAGASVQFDYTEKPVEGGEDGLKQLWLLTLTAE